MLAERPAETAVKPVHIYVLIDPRDGLVKYVGKASHPRARLADHISNAHRHRHRCARWIQHLKADGLVPRMVVIESNPRDWRAAEKQWIAFWRNLGRPLTNLAEGGYGSDGYVMTDEAKVKISSALKAHCATPEGQAHIARIARRGADNNKAKMTAAQVVEIRERYAAGGVTYTALAAEFGISRASLARIVHGDVWTHVGGPITPSSRPRWLTEDDVREIRRVRAETGLSYQKIGEPYGLSRSHIRDIVLRRRWRHLDT